MALAPGLVRSIPPEIPSTLHVRAEKSIPISRLPTHPLRI